MAKISQLAGNVKGSSAEIAKYIKYGTVWIEMGKQKN